MDFSQPTVLGRTGLNVGRLGISSSFGAPTNAFLEAFECGCNYFTWGTFIRGRSGPMGEAIRTIVGSGDRDKLVVAMLTYAHQPWLTEHFLIKGLKIAQLEYTDVLLLGYYSKRPPQKVIDSALSLKEKGLVRFIGLTTHNRRLITELNKEGVFDIIHLRYNATHRGAEEDIFPFLTEGRPGLVGFTATDWRKLLKPGKMPPGEKPLTAAECYRFVLTNPAIDVCMTGAKDMRQMRENLGVLKKGPLTALAMKRIRRIGQHVYGK